MVESPHRIVANPADNCNTGSVFPFRCIALANIDKMAMIWQPGKH